MSSFILHFKAWIAAALLLVAIETAVASLGRPSEFERTNFLQFSFAHDETPQRLFVFDKIRAFAELNPTIVQSGDSSGFYGIEPAVVMRHLPAGVTYLNLSCCANLGFKGYYNILDFMAERDALLRYMVLHITPYTMPLPGTWGSDGAALWGIPDVKVFGDAFYEEFMSVWRIFHVPSLAYRRQVTDRVYYLNGLFNQLDRPLLNNVNYIEFLKVYRQTHGWMRKSDARNGVSTAECNIPVPKFFDFRTLSYRSYLEDVVDSYAALAKRHNATLVIVFQPVACALGTGARNAEARAMVEHFKRDHPDVEIPFRLIETWPADMFSVPAHVRWEYTDLIGNRLGKAMAEIINRREPR